MKNPHAVALGSLGGKSKSEAKIAAARANGKKNVRSMCEHICLGNCRRYGCNCKCGEYHCDPQGVFLYQGEDGPCRNHPTVIGGVDFELDTDPFLNSIPKRNSVVPK